MNDVLLDEFNIPHQCAHVQPKMDPLDPTHNKKLLQHFITNPPFLKYIEFDDAGADALDVVLKIQNDDNNYANGFMSKFTHIMLSHVYLQSKRVLENIDTINNGFKFSRLNWRKFNSNIINFYSYYNRNQLFKNFESVTIANFPNIEHNPNYYVGDYRIGSSGYRIGSSGYFHFSLKKKLGFWRSSTDRSRGFWSVGSADVVKYLYDKYKSYEDTRTTDQ